jgi:hypothetical protein
VKRKNLLRPFLATIFLLLIGFSVILPIAGLRAPQTISSYGTVTHPAESRILTVIKRTDLSVLTEEQLTDLAIKFDLVITWPMDPNSYPISVLRRANPKIKILLYRNVAFIDERARDQIELARANGWILKDAVGEEVYEREYTFLKLVDVGNASYRNWVAERIKNWTDRLGADGVLGDNTNAWAGVDTYIMNADPINPRTIVVYGRYEYRDDMLNLVKAVKERIGEKLYIANGIGALQGSYGNGFWNNRELVEALIDEVDGVLMEGFIRFGNEAWRTETSWKKDLEFLDYLCKRGKVSISWTVTYGTLPQGYTKYEVAMYGLTSYLLGKSGTYAYFSARNYEENFSNVSKTDVGFPIDEYHIRADVSVYERKYSRSVILVNPTNNNFTIYLDEYHRTLEGQIVREITLKAKTGTILLYNF